MEWPDILLNGQKYSISFLKMTYCHLPNKWVGPNKWEGLHKVVFLNVLKAISSKSLAKSFFNQKHVFSTRLDPPKAYDSIKNI